MDLDVTVWANDAFENIKELENTSPTISTKVEHLRNDTIFAIGKSYLCVCSELVI